MKEFIINLLHYLFGMEFIMLNVFENKFIIKRAYEIKGILYVNYWGQRNKLLENGKVDGVAMAKKWEPLTSGMYKIQNDFILKSIRGIK